MTSTITFLNAIMEVKNLYLDINRTLRQLSAQPRDHDFHTGFGSYG
jgi:hypothetical protein